MWRKTLSSFFIGLLLSTSLILNVNHFIPLDVDVKLLVGYVAGFITWSALMTYFFCFESVKRPFIQCTCVLLVSVALNVVIKLGALS